MSKDSGHNTKEDLLDKNIVSVIGKVDGDMVFYIRDSMAKLICRDSPDIFVTIFSGGGNVAAGLDIFDMLKLYPGKKTAVVFGNAKSMAAVIMQACETRLATKHSRIMIHHISSGDISLDTLRDKSRREKFVADMERNQEYLYQILSERTGKDVTVIREECAKERDMSADEAKSFGLIDEIWTKPFPF